jgi:cytochrome c oxidase subunit 4
MSDHHNEDVKAPIPHVLPAMVYWGVLGVLIFLTVLTVATAQIDIGVFNFPLAMVIATTKATIVAAIFMHLWFDSKLNAVVFVCALLFLAIFIVLTASDLLTRSEVDPTRANYSIRDDKVREHAEENPNEPLLRPKLMKAADQEEKRGHKLIDQHAEGDH